MRKSVFNIFLKHIDVLAHEPDINLAALVLKNRIVDHLKNKSAKKVKCKEYLIPLMEELNINVLGVIPDRGEFPNFKII
jgi:hypothetical protein